MTAPDENGWMPIETFFEKADKTERVLLCLSTGEVVIGSHFGALCDFWNCGERVFSAGEPHFHSINGTLSKGIVTNWQPLPHPPVDGASQ